MCNHQNGYFCLPHKTLYHPPKQQTRLTKHDRSQNATTTVIINANAYARKQSLYYINSIHVYLYIKGISTHFTDSLSLSLLLFVCSFMSKDMSDKDNNINTNTDTHSLKFIFNLRVSHVYYGFYLGFAHFRRQNSDIY